MAEWSFVVPPDVTVTVRARRWPSLLARCLGSAVEAAHGPDVLLDLAAPERWDRALVQGLYKGIPWSCSSSIGQDGGRRLAWRSPALSEYLALHVALLPTLRQLLAERNSALVLGAAFETRGAATLMAGATGTGKTKTLLGVLARGGTLIGDEYVGVGSTGEVAPIVRALALRRSSLELAPHMFGRLSRGRQLQLRSAELTARFTRNHLDPLAHVSPAELGLRASPGGGVPLRTVLWLEAGGGSVLGCEAMPPREAIERLAAMQANHDRAYGAIDSAGSDGERSVERWRDVLERGLAGASCYRLSLPDEPSWPEVLEQVLEAGGSPVAERPAA